MGLKKDSNAVSIDMLLIVHSEKRRAAQGTHSDRQADPGAPPPQRRGGKVRPARPQAAPGTSPSPPKGPPAAGRPHTPPNEVSDTDPLPMAGCASTLWLWRLMATRSPVIAPG